MLIFSHDMRLQLLLSLKWLLSSWTCPAFEILVLFPSQQGIVARPMLSLVVLSQSARVHLYVAAKVALHARLRGPAPASPLLLDSFPLYQRAPLRSLVLYNDGLAKLLYILLKASEQSPALLKAVHVFDFAFSISRTVILLISLICGVCVRAHKDGLWKYSEA